MSQELRETVLFLAGLAAFTYVLVMPAARDISILILIGGMLGVPAVLPLDRRRNRETLRRDVPPDEPLPAPGGDGSGGGEGG